MSQAAEIPVTYAQLLVYAIGLDAPEILWGPSFSTGTRVWLRRNGFWRAYLVTDLLPPTSPFGFDQTLPTFTSTPGGAARRIAVQFPAGTTVSIAAGSSFQTGIGNGNGLAAGATVVGPGAGTIITSVITVLPAQNYLVWVATDLGPGAVAADIGNMGYTDGTLTVGALARGINGPFRSNLAVGSTCQVQTIGAGTAGVNYTASLSVIPVP